MKCCVMYNRPMLRVPLVTMVMMLLAVALTADQLVTEKEEGLLTRDYVCGVGVPVYLAAQITVRRRPI